MELEGIEPSAIRCRVCSPHHASPGSLEGAVRLSAKIIYLTAPPLLHPSHSGFMAGVWSSCFHKSHYTDKLTEHRQSLRLGTP